MAEATLSRPGGASVSFPLVEEGGSTVYSRTLGKPEVSVFNQTQSLEPRAQDQFNALQTLNLAGRLFDYSDVIALADLLKSADGSGLTLDVDVPEHDDGMTVVPNAGQDTALSVTYPAGKTDNVSVELGLTRVSTVNNAVSQSASTPTATGSGPITFTINGESVTCPTADLQVERAVGRPNDVARRSPADNWPRVYQQPKAAFDEFVFSFADVSTGQAVITQLSDLVFKQQLGRTGLEVDFQGFLGLGEFDAMPTGSSAFRETRLAGRGWAQVPAFSLRRIQV